MYENRPRPGLDYLFIEILFLAIFVLFPQIQCRTGCFVWTPWRIFLFGVIYTGLLWHIVDSFRVKYVLEDKQLRIKAPWFKKRLPVDSIREIHPVPGFCTKALLGWSNRNALNRYHNLVLLITGEGQRYLLSPTNPVQFMEMIKSILPENRKQNHGK